MKKNSVGHFEIYANDPDKLQQFYTSLFDWNVAAVQGMDYRFITTVDVDEQGRPTTPGGINGGRLERPAGYDARAWVNDVNVPSLDEAVQQATGLGATLMKGRTAVAGMGWFAMLVDPEGNPFAVWQMDHNAQ